MALSAEERAYLEALRSIGEMWQRRVEYLFGAIEHCYEKASTKGLEEMVAFSFNGAGIAPQYGSAGGLPVGKHPVKIVGTALKPTADNTGGYMELTLEAIDGPAKGAKAIDRLNLNNTSSTAVRIAQQQLAAYMVVMGMNPEVGFNDTNELHDKPFVVEMVQQKSNPQYTEVGAIFDMNGNKPGEGGGNAGNNAGASQQGGASNAGGNAGGNGGNWGGNAGNGQQGGNGGNNGQNAGNGGGWGNGGNNAGQQGGNGQQGGQNGNGWNQGGNGGGDANGGQNGQQGGGWQQNAGGGNGGGGNPGWGNPNG